MSGGAVDTGDVVRGADVRGDQPDVRALSARGGEEGHRGIAVHGEGSPAPHLYFLTDDMLVSTHPPTPFPAGRGPFYYPATNRSRLKARSVCCRDAVYYLCSIPGGQPEHRSCLRFWEFSPVEEGRAIMLEH